MSMTAPAREERGRWANAVMRGSDVGAALGKPLRHRRRRALCAAALLLMPLNVFALSLGALHVRSGLNQPLDAYIDIAFAEGERLADVQAAVSSDETYRRLGIPHLSVLRTLRLELQPAGDGRGRLLLRTRPPLTEPVLELALELRTDNTRLVRAYTLLLDPVPVPQPSVAAPEPAADRPTRAFGPVPPNAILARIADQLLDGGVTREQMMVALFRRNPHAFYRPNVNALKAGVMLDVPSVEQAQGAAPDVAREEIMRQYRVWGARSSPAAQATKTLSEPDPVTVIPAAAAPKPLLHLVGSASAVQQPAAFAPAELRTRLTDLLKMNQALREENALLREQLVVIEQQVKRVTEQILALPVGEAAQAPAPPLLAGPASQPPAEERSDTLYWSAAGGATLALVAGGLFGWQRYRESRQRLRLYVRL